MEYEQSLSYKLLNSNAQWAANWHIGLDKNTKLVDFSGMLSDMNGRILRKIKKSDLKSTQLSEGMSDDITTRYLDLTPPSYPCMLTFTVRVKKVDGVLSYPVFCPITRPRMAVQQATYQLVLPPSRKCRWHVENMDNTVRESRNERGQMVYSVECGALDAFDDVPFSPDITDVVPMAFFAPDDFSYDGWKGRMDSWNLFGKWHADLMEGRQVIPDNMKSSLRQMTDTCTTDRSKIDVLYRWLQRNTRYVSVQLGVGGYQPFSADYVCKSGFGDCKGLSNLMVAMLREVGITAYYVVIGTDSKRLFHDYPNANQFNHALAMAVLPQDTVWLECTSPHLPTGFLHDGIAGHEALAITPRGGELVTVPAYEEQENVVRSTMKIHLHGDGKADVDCHMSAACSKYGDFFALSLMDDNQRQSTLKGLMKLGQASLDGVRVADHRENAHRPEIDVYCKAHAGNVASATGQRLFVPLRPMFSFPRDLPDGSRTLNIELPTGCSYEYNLDIEMPEGYEIEAAPAPMKVDSPYGSSSFDLSAREGHVSVRHVLTLHQGTYPAERYPEFRAFLRSALVAYAQKVVLKRIS